MTLESEEEVTQKSSTGIQAHPPIIHSLASYQAWTHETKEVLSSNRQQRSHQTKAQGRV